VFIGGRVLNPHELGLYTEALFLTQIFVSRFIPPLNDVAFPAYSRMQNDPAKVVASFSHAIRLLLLIACPVYFGMAAVSEPLVATLFGRKWLGMAPFISILALAMPFLTIQVMFAPVTNGLGRPGTTARISAIGAVLMPTSFLIAIQFGAIGLAWAWLVSYPILLGFTIRLAGRPIGISARIVAEAALPPLICAITMGLIVAGVGTLVPTTLSPLLRLAMLAAVGAAAYVLALRIWAPRLLQEAFDLVVRRKATPAMA
jgi:O-antigen/teichoic acid export membrane protein